VSAPEVEARGLAVGYEGRPILQGLDFAVERGDIFALLGASGSGKSTVLKCLIGLLEPIAGEVRFRGEPPPQLEDRRPHWGTMFQAGALFGSLTVAENVALPLEQWTGLGRDAIDAIVRARLRLVGLAGAEHLKPAELSGGMRKRVAIARALALEPPVLFFDEPSAGLDPIGAAELDELILTLNGTLGVTAVIVTHELLSIFKIVRHCVLLDREAGGIVARGEPRALRDESRDPRVRAFFHREPRRNAS
jgi:phospholipid/cholesterol/gamma-HCH transport system ATP-binding protein